MKIEQLIDVLAAHSKILEDAGASDSDGQFRLLIEALRPVGAVAVKAACSKVAKLAGRDPAAATVASGPLAGALFVQLALLGDLLKAAGAKSAGDVVQLTEALKAIAGLPIASIPEAWVAKPAKTNAKSKSIPVVEIDAISIRDMPDRLAAANGDDHKFKSILAELKARKLPKAAVFAIANRFLGVEPERTYKPISLAFERIEERHFQDAISASRERAINRINH